jgi:hypothetical protein
MRSSTSSRRASCGGSGWCARPTSGRPAARTVVPDHGPDRGGPRDAGLGLVGAPEADAAAGEDGWNLVEPALHAGRSCVTFGGPWGAGLVVFDDGDGDGGFPGRPPVRSAR